MKSAFPSHQLDRYLVRFPDGMRARLAADASAAGRSLNAEIVHRLSPGADDVSRDINPFGLRMQDELREVITLAAGLNGRSMNAEIVHRLEESIRAPIGGQIENLRDDFAGKAMHAELVSAGSHKGPAQALADAAEQAGRSIEDQIAFNAYEMADAMLARRAIKEQS